MNLFTLDDFSDDELLDLLNCTKLKHVQHRFSPEQQDRLKQYKPQHPHKKKFASKLFLSFFVPLKDFNSFPLILFLSAMGVITLEVLSLLIGTVIFAFLTLLLGALIVYGNYKEIEKAHRKHHNAYTLQAIQIIAAETLLKRHGLRIDVTAYPEFRLKHRLSMLKNALIAGMLIATPLFGTYFMAVNVITSAVHTSAAIAFLGGWPGLLIGIGVALTIGLICGYQYYQASKEETRLAFDRKYLSREMQHKKTFALGMQKGEITKKGLALFSQKPLPPSPTPKMTFGYHLCAQSIFAQKERKEGYEITLSPVSLGK